MKIFIDFDDVLFNTRDFKKDLINVFERSGVTKEQFKAESYWRNKYNLEKQLESLEKKYKINRVDLRKDLDDFLKDLKKYVFLDVALFLQSVGRENLFLISYGEEEIQMQKIKNSGLENYFKKIVITDSIKSRAILKIVAKKNIKDTGENYFIDDRVDYVQEVKKDIPNIKTILVKRLEGRYEDSPNNYCDYVVDNLERLQKLLTL